MERKNKNTSPIYYKTAEEMEAKPLSGLMEDLRTDVAKIRGKLHDIKFSFGWEDRIEHIEGGLTCMLVAMAITAEEWKKFEDKKNNLEKAKVNYKKEQLVPTAPSHLQEQIPQQKKPHE